MKHSKLVISILVAMATPALAQPGAGARPGPPPTVFDSSGISDWATPPKPTKEPGFTPPVGKRMKLANGVQLLVVENHKLPIVSMQLVIPGAGYAADPSGKGGLAAFTADLLDEGAGGLSPIAIAEETDRLGAGISVSTDADAAYVAISTLAKTLDSTIELATKVITQPGFDDKEADRVKGDRSTSLELRRDRPREVAALMLNGALYGADSAYGHPGSGLREEFKGVTVADARTFYQEHWNPAVMTLVVVGDIDPKAMKAKLDAGLGAWKPTGSKRPSKIVAAPAKLANRLLLVDRPAAAQSDVRIGLVGPDRKDKRFFAFEVYRTTLGDGFTSRLTQRLREQLGITYGASANMDWRVARGPFVIGTAIVTAATGQGLSETLKLVEELTTTDIPAAELEKSKQNLIRALPARFGTNASTADAFAELVLQGLPDTWYARYAEGVRKVSAKDVKAAAKALVPSKQLVISVVGDMSKVRADIDKLDLGDPAMFDLYGMPLKK
ncbi:MAG: insulinase family protein [Myxococcales bacterium]|nr:insulinase family protein [Myxococcales bacterium]